MTDTLVHRGPDDFGYHCDKNVGLGMRRLSIIDLAGGQQPIRSQSGRYVAVFNGEIYNYRELRQELLGKGVAFRSEGDGEVIVNLYEHQGLDMLNRLRGMFALALWDTVERELLLVRDQLGIKPLFFSQQGQTLLFGSEIKSILEALPGPLTVDAQALDAILAYNYVPAPLSIWKDIRKLRPGHFLKWRGGSISEQRYWNLLDADVSPVASVHELRKAIDDTVRAHLVSDVEVGVFLSGGLDSSTIVVRMQQCLESKIRAFSVRFDTRSHLVDETRFAEELRNAHGFDLHIESLPASAYECISDAMRAFDEPFADDSLVPSNAISAIAAEHVKVVLSGAGGDEFFGGYNRYQGVVMHQRLAAVPFWLRVGVVSPAFGLLSLAMGRGSRKGDLAGRFARCLHCSIDDAYLAYVTAASPEVRRQLLAPDVRAAVNADETRALIGDYLAQAARLDPLKRVMYADVCTYLPDNVLALSDRLGMWHSLEIRTPLADKDLAAFAFRFLPMDLVTLRQKKVALKRAVAHWLPKSILAHPKQGFEGPTASWLRQEGAECIRSAIEQHRTAHVPLLRAGYLEPLLAEHVASKADHAKLLFSSLTVMEWAALNQKRIAGVA